MSHVWTIARKELRGYFNSAVALIFLATFLGVVMFTFFWVDKFFARGVTDLRPMFDWMPLLLIFLVAALSMRLWSEERKTGTLEVLLTLPVPRWQLVLGKFVAGMVLVALALALTLGLPITVSMMGNLDWGPVIGGYVAALLLAGAYLAIGMCVSSSTDNQIVALILTALVCLLLYLPGTSQVAGLVGLESADRLRQLGTGSRFASIARGVLDLRDLAYYLSLTAVFLALDVVLLGARRWSRGPRARKQRRAAQLAVALTAANALVLNVWLAPVAQARVDLTQNGEYSLSSTTKKLVGHLDEPLLIRAYFSSKMHPILAPLVPQIRDLLEEYRIAGDGRVRVETVDPTTDEKLEKEAKDDYGIESVPLRFADRHEKGVVSTFFHILIQYGDQHEVLGFDDLIEVKSLDVGDIQVKLKNLEYDLTRTIKKVVYGFQSLDALFASLPSDVELTEYITPDTLPENWKDGPAALDKVVAELTEQAGGKLKVTKVTPKTDAEMQQIYDDWGIRPYASLGSGNIYYFHILVKIGDRAVRVPPPDTLDEAALRAVMTQALQTAAPGFNKVVGLWTPQPGYQDAMEPGQPPQQTPPPASYENLSRELNKTYEVQDVSLHEKVPSDVDVLIVAGPTGMTPDQVTQIDQFLMRGGAVILLDGQYRLDLGGRRLMVEKVESGLDAMLASYGVTVQDQMVLDRKSETFPLRVSKDLNDVADVPYPYFVRVDELPASVITAGLPGALMQWASPVVAPVPTGEGARKVETLIRSSSASWLDNQILVEPDFTKYPQGGFPPPPDDLSKKGAQVLGVAVTGGFDSFAATQPDKPEGLIEHSPPDARLVVIGSSSFASDAVVDLSQQLGMDLADANLTLVQNAVDWAVADTDLLTIRARSSGTRALKVAEGERSKWEWINYGLAFAGLGGVVLISWLRRRSVQPMVLPEVTP